MLDSVGYIPADATLTLDEMVQGLNVYSERYGNDPDALEDLRIAAGQVMQAVLEFGESYYGN